jgi:beta-N-acetylhexosaminidase
MFAASLSGTVVTDGLRHLILDDKVGTVLLFRTNFGNAAGLRRWTAQLQALGRQAGLPAPLMVTTDEEGGTVDQVADGLRLLPAAQTLAGEGPAGVRRDVAVMASGLRADGIGIDLAPVVDLRTNPADGVIGSRSFGSDAAVVGPLVAAYVEGLHDSGVAATLKHFPGLGGAAGDPHVEAVSDPVTMEQWSATTARSFAAGIAAGADAVMTTSLRVPNLDPSNRPALLSPVIVDLLRNTLDFGGVIVTDSLSMTAVGEPLPKATLDAATAGNDLLLMSSGSTTLEDQAYQLVLAAVRSGAITQAQVRASAERVLALHERYVVAPA